MSVNLQFAKLERRIYGPYSPGTRMRNGIFRVYVHSNAGDIISRDGRTIIKIYNIKFAHSCTVYVGLAQARPNNICSLTTVIDLK